MVPRRNSILTANAENIPPPPMSGNRKKAFTSIGNSAARRRERVYSGSHKTFLKIQQAKRRSEKEKKEKERDRKRKEELNFKVPALPAVMTELEVADVPATPDNVASATPAPAGPPNGQRPFMFNVPQYLCRPPRREIEAKVLMQLAPMKEDTNVAFLRDVMAADGHEMLRSVATVRPSLNAPGLPRQMTVTIAPNTTHLPSHMLAVFHRYVRPAVPGVPAQPRKVTLYPVHSLMLAANCAVLPPIPQPMPVPDAIMDGTSNQLTIPVWPLALPHPYSYNQLSSYLYTKDVDFLMKTALPIPPPPNYFENQKRMLAPFATTMAQTFTTLALAKAIVGLHGLWANAFSLEVVDRTFWDVLDLMWRTMTTAMAISTGVPLPRYDGPSPVSKQGAPRQPFPGAHLVPQPDMPQTAVPQPTAPGLSSATTTTTAAATEA